MRPRHNPSRVAIAVLVALLTVDALFVVLHITHPPVPADDAFSSPVIPRLSFDAERGYPERFGYAKLFLAASGLVLVYRWVKQPVYLGWSFALLVALADDAFSVHERLGSSLADWLALAPSFGLRAQDFGELGVWSILGAVVLTALLWAHHRSAAEARGDSRNLALLALALAFFAVAMDMVHVTVSGTAERIVGGVEGGGELIVPSFIVAYVVASSLRIWNSVISRQSRRSAPP